MKPFGSAKLIMDGVTDARTDVMEAAAAVRDAARIGIVVFTLVGIVAAVALITAAARS